MVSWPFLEYIFILIHGAKKHEQVLRRLDGVGWGGLAWEREDNCWCGRKSSSSHVQKGNQSQERGAGANVLTLDKEGTKGIKKKLKKEWKAAWNLKKKKETQGEQNEKEKGSVTNWWLEKRHFNTSRQMVSRWNILMQNQTYLTDADLKLWSLPCSFNSPHALFHSLNFHPSFVRPLCQLMRGIVSFCLAHSRCLSVTLYRLDEDGGWSFKTN